MADGGPGFFCLFRIFQDSLAFAVVALSDGFGYHRTAKCLGSGFKGSSAIGDFPFRRWNAKLAEQGFLCLTVLANLKRPGAGVNRLVLGQLLRHFNGQVLEFVGYAVDAGEEVVQVAAVAIHNDFP